MSVTTSSTNAGCNFMTWTVPGQPDAVLNESDISHRGQNAERRLGDLTSKAPVV